MTSTKRNLFASSTGILCQCCSPSTSSSSPTSLCVRASPPNFYSTAYHVVYDSQLRSCDGNKDRQQHRHEPILTLGIGLLRCFPLLRTATGIRPAALPALEISGNERCAKTRTPKTSLDFQLIRYIVILWGICVTLNCVVKNFASLISLRILLGVFESVSAPSLILVVSMWYKKTGTLLSAGSE